MMNLKKSIANNLRKLLNLFKDTELLIISVYQKTFSLDYGYLGKVFPNSKSCRHIPTCSVYGYECVNRFGIFRGNYFLVKRVLRCNPWNKSDIYDPVPEK
jgi:putative membrane protein insertion efficiency factor